MQLITNEKWLAAISGGEGDGEPEYTTTAGQVDPGSGPDNSVETVADKAPSGDQRSPEQIAAQAEVDKGNQACAMLPPGAAQTCTQLNNAQGYNLAAQAYAICIATGGQPGPTSCGVRPTPPKLSK